MTPKPAPAADGWNATHPIGTPVLAWPGSLRDEPLVTRTRTTAWTLGHGVAVVAIEGRTGGIALTHIQPIPTCGAVSEHGDVCERAENHAGLCRSKEPRKYVSSPEKAWKRWFWYRTPAAPEAVTTTREDAR